MVKRNPPRVPSAAGELAAKLQAITDAAPGLWRAGVTSMRVGEIRFELQEAPRPRAERTQEDEAADSDPLSLAAYRRGMVAP